MALHQVAGRQMRSNAGHIHRLAAKSLRLCVRVCPRIHCVRLVHSLMLFVSFTVQCRLQRIHNTVYVGPASPRPRPAAWLSSSRFAGLSPSAVTQYCESSRRIPRDKQRVLQCHARVPRAGGHWHNLSPAGVDKARSQTATKRQTRRGQNIHCAPPQPLRQSRVQSRAPLCRRRLQQLKDREAPSTFQGGRRLRNGTTTWRYASLCIAAAFPCETRVER